MSLTKIFKYHKRTDYCNYEFDIPSADVSSKKENIKLVTAVNKIQKLQSVKSTWDAEWNNIP